jgi:hypothetical protein
MENYSVVKTIAADVGSTAPTYEVAVYRGNSEACIAFAALRNSYPNTSTPIPGTSPHWVETTSVQ